MPLPVAVHFALRQPPFATAVHQTCLAEIIMVHELITSRTLRAIINERTLVFHIARRSLALGSDKVNESESPLTTTFSSLANDAASAITSGEFTVR